MSKNSDNLSGCLIIFGIIVGISLIISILQVLINFIINNYKIILIILSILITIAIIIIIFIKNKKDKNQNTTYYNNSNYEHHTISTQQVIENKRHEQVIKTKTQQQIFEEEAREILKKVSNSKRILNKQSKYHLKTKTITDNEQYFLEIIKKHFSKQYEIRPQVPLSSIIEKEKNFSREYQNELNRIIDIGIFDKETTAPLLLIEINDSTHEQKYRKARDYKVKEICNDAQISLITFLLKYSNTEQYIVERINNELKKNSIK